MNEDNRSVKDARDEISDPGVEEKTHQRPNLTKRMAEIIKQASRRRGRPPKNKAAIKRTVRIFKQSKRGRGRPHCKKKSRSPLENTEETEESQNKNNSLQVQRLRTQPKRSSKRI